MDHSWNPPGGGASIPGMVKWTARPGDLPSEARWLDGHIYRLEPGKDFKHLGALRAKIWKLADRLEIHPRTRLEDGYLYVQALDGMYRERPDAQIRTADGTPVP